MKAPTAPDDKKIGKGKAGPGRPPGALNKRTILGKTVTETFKNMLGLDDAAVERTGQIDGKGYGCRLRLQQMFNGHRDVDPAFVGLLRVALSYAYGNPRPMAADTAGAFARRLAFITPSGLPWENDPLYDRERRMLEQQRVEEALQLEVAKAREADPAAPAAADQKAAFDIEERLELVKGI